MRLDREAIAKRVYQILHEKSSSDVNVEWSYGCGQSNFRRVADWIENYVNAQIVEFAKVERKKTDDRSDVPS